MFFIFVITAVLIFLTIAIDSVLLNLQYETDWFTDRFGEKYDFYVHSIITLFSWILTAGFLLLLQTNLDSHPNFHDIEVLFYLGWGFLIIGLVISVWGFAVLGLKRSLHLNFFRDDVPRVESSIYGWMKNPEYNGFWFFLIGLALLTASHYNLFIAVEFIVLMIPLERIERQPLQD